METTLHNPSTPLKMSYCFNTLSATGQRATKPPVSVPRSGEGQASRGLTGSICDSVCVEYANESCQAVRSLPLPADVYNGTFNLGPLSDVGKHSGK
jgi:hypothetical protein